MRPILFILLCSFNFICFCQRACLIEDQKLFTTNEDSSLTKKCQIDFMFQYRTILFDFPKFHFNGRTSYLNFSAKYKRFEFGIGINPFGVVNYKKINADFSSTDEWISKSNLWLLYLDFPINIETNDLFKITKGKLLIGASPQFLIAGKSQFVTQLDNPLIVHNYDLYKNPNYKAFETKFNIRFQIEYRIVILKKIEIGFNILQNLRKIAPSYFQVNHSYFPLTKPIVVNRVGGFGLTIGYNF